MKYIVLFTLFVATCCKPKSAKVQSAYFRMDTLRSTNVEKECSSQTKGFYKKFGSVISNYYEVNDYLAYEINGDNQVDTFAILTPASLVPGELGNLCSSELYDENRLLVKFIAIDKNVSKIEVMPNIISNQATMAWTGHEKFEETKNGFILRASKGQGCKFNYSIFIIKKENDFFIDSIRLSSYCPSGDNSKEKKIDYTNDRFKLSAYNRAVIDSLKLINDM